MHLSALASWLGVLLVGSAMAKQAFDCNHTTSCETLCASSSSTSRIFHFYVGETLSWNCTLGENCPNASVADINFCFKGNVPDHLTHVVDSRTKELRIPNVTEDHTGSYFCYVSGCRADDIEMQIAYPAEPPDVQVWYEYLSGMAERLTVTATPKARNRNVNWTWDIRYKLDTRRAQDYYDDLSEFCLTENKNWTCDTSQMFPCSCPEIDSGRECKLQNEGNNFCFISDRNHIIRVKMSSESFGSAHEDVTVKPSRKIARAPQVYNLSSNVSSRQADVGWKMWPGLQNMMYNVSYRPVGNVSWQKYGETSNTSVTIRGLLTNTAYQFRVSAKFKVSTLWSIPVEAKFNTAEDVPSESPKLCPGSYIYVSAPDCPGEGRESLFLYIKPIPVESQNGKLLNYVLNVNPPLANETNPVRKPVTNQTIVLCGVRRDKDSVVELRASSKIGVSVVPSRIIIPSKAPLKPIQVIVEKLDADIIHVKWTNRLNTSQRHNVTIHHCQQIDRHLKCLAGYGWETVTGPASSHNISFQSDLRVGVSVEVGGVSSGIAWSSCLYDSSSVPGKVTGFHVELLEKNVLLEWSPPDCRQLTSLPSLYEVRYGIVSEENSSAQCDTDAAVLQPQNLHDCFPDPVVRTLCNSSLEFLLRGYKYFACVRGISHGRKGMWYYRQTYIPDTNVPLIVGLSVGGTLLIAIVIFLGRCCYVKHKASMIKFEYPDYGTAEQSPYYEDSNGYPYQTLSTGITEMSNGGASESNGHIPSSVNHRATNGGFMSLSHECPAPDSPGSRSPVPGSPVLMSPGPHSPEPHQFQPASPGEHLSEIGASSRELSRTQSLTSQDVTRNDDSLEHTTPVLRDSLGSHVLEDNSVPGSADTRLTGDTQEQPLDNEDQDALQDTDEEEISDTDESDGYKVRSMKPAETLSSLPGSHPSGSKDELSKKHTDTEKKKDLVGNHNFSGPASRSNSMTSYSRMSSVKRGSSMSDTSSEHSMPSTAKTPVRGKASHKHRAGIEGAEATTPQTSV